MTDLFYERKMPQGTKLTWHVYKDLALMGLTFYLGEAVNNNKHNK